MQAKEYDTIVFNGRFRPLHNAHMEMIRRASKLARQVIVIIGSADQPRTFKNPFTNAEVKTMLINAINADPHVDRTCAIRLENNRDTIYNDQAWVIRVQEIVAKHAAGHKKIGIIGHLKDESSFYLKMFPQWSFIEQELIEPLDATQIRTLFFTRKPNLHFFEGVVPAATIQFLDMFSKTVDFQTLIAEKEHIDNYKKQFEGLKYAPIFVTADAVVIQSGHVLMVRRKDAPGKGLWALPGGFMEAETDKSVIHAAIRELKQETKIKVPEKVLFGSITATKVFDAIARSLRGRTITHAVKIVLPDDEELPKVKGSDDAEIARWVPLAELRSEDCFEDHYEIIMHFVGN